MGEQDMQLTQGLKRSWSREGTQILKRGQQREGNRDRKPQGLPRGGQEAQSSVRSGFMEADHRTRKVRKDLFPNLNIRDPRGEQ